MLQCLPFWPEASTGKLCARVVGSESSSKSFFFQQAGQRNSAAHGTGEHDLTVKMMLNILY